MNDFTPLPDNAPWWARWIVDNYNMIWRQCSTWFITAAGLVALIPSNLWQQLGLSEGAQRYATAACAVGALLSKYVKQTTAGDTKP